MKEITWFLFGLTGIFVVVLLLLVISKDNLLYAPLFLLLWSPLWLTYFTITRWALIKFNSNNEKRISYALLGLICGLLAWVPSPLPPYLFILPLALMVLGLHFTVLTVFVVIKHFAEKRIRAQTKRS